MRSAIYWSTVGSLFLILVTSTLMAQAAIPSFAWLEGENPARINVTPKEDGVGNPQFLSENQWLKVVIDADNVDKEAPAEGVLIAYEFATDQEGEYEVWARIGFEAVRSLFEWRLDNGSWTTVTPDKLTTDLMELSFWTEVAWFKLGRLTLAMGDHKLEFRLPKTQDAEGKPQRILFALDALCIQAGTFYPHGKFKPDQDGRDAIDVEAAQTVFQFPEKTGDAQVGLSLNGLWEVCRHDEQMPGEVAAPIRSFPEKPHWVGIPVPSDKNQSRPDLLFAHRLWYRTRVDVPLSRTGQSFHLVFPQNNLNTTVYVNGQYCGFDKNPFARVQIDVSKGIKPGLNEIWVGIKDAWYGYSANPDQPLLLRKKWNLPLKYLSDGFQPLAYPIWHHAQSGILVTPQLVAGGTVYASDVFCQPSVARQELALEITLRNGSAKAQSGTLICEAVSVRSGQVEKTFPAQSFTVAPEQEKLLNLVQAWKNPKLWWPDAPELYRLRTSIQIEGQTVDIKETTFGFREWSARGKDFTLNGVPWHVWADTFTAPDPATWLERYHEMNQTTMRFWGTKWQGLPPEEALDFFDRHGVACRRSGILDGEAIGYMAIEPDEGLKTLHGSEIKMDLMQNWKDQMLAQVKGERNHPSVMLWSIENEWLYINCINLYGGLMDTFEAEVLKVSDAVRALDPTRLTMTDGGGANKDNTMPVHGNHYVWDSKMTRYPDLAYQVNPTGGGRGRWVWDEQRPRFLGEDYFIAGHHPELSYIGGEAVFGGKSASLPASGLMARILTEGYRWAEFGGFHFWMGQSDADGTQYNSFAPRTVFCRQWDWTFGSGQTVTRTLGVFNDTHSIEPITFAWALNIKGQLQTSGRRELRVAPGGNEKFDLELVIPEVSQRTEAEWVLTLAVHGEEVYRDVKHVSVLNPAALWAREPSSPALASRDLLVLDPGGEVKDYLGSHRQPFTVVEDLARLPESGKVLLVGKDALTEIESTSSRWAAWAASGRAVIILEQAYPLKYQALPSEMESAANQGRTAFVEDLGHPVMRGLKQKDFFTWEPGSLVYRNAYVKPTRGAKSLIQCDELLRHSALVEVPAGKGVMLLSQLCVGEKLERHAAAQTLLWGLLNYAADYKQEFLPVAAVVSDDSPLANALHATGLKFTPQPGLLKALENGRIAIVSATPDNLKALVSMEETVRRFTADGGWIVLNGLTPEGLSDFNHLVGVPHMIRPFRQEKVSFPPVKNHLTAGLTIGDVALFSSERIFPWQKGNYVADDTFSYCVDYDEVASFARYPSDYFHNMINGMVSADSWKYIYSFELKRGDTPEWDMTFPVEQEFIEWTWIGNAFYHPVTRVELTFDGQDTAVFETEPNNQPQTFSIDPPRRGKVVRAKIAGWQKLPDKNDVVGVDNLYFKVKRSPDFLGKVKPMLNVGGLMEYPQGQGGIVLCNVRFRETEPLPANGPKKQAILATILRNLKAPFSGKSVIAGAKLRYSAIDLSQKANAFRDEKGWFGDDSYTFKDLPTGRQTMAGVPYDIYEFATSPVPTALMLSDKASRPAKEIRGIPVNRKADALFFLHTMKLDRRMNDDDRRKNQRFETLRYAVNYADGQTQVVPVMAEVDIHDYRQKSPRAIPGAQMAWTKPYEGTEYSAVAYARQWNNPRPEVQIKSIDMLPGEQPRGVPALLAVTAASVE